MNHNFEEDPGQGSHDAEVDEADPPIKHVLRKRSGEISSAK